MAQARSDTIIEVIGVDKASRVYANVARAQDQVTAGAEKNAAAAEKSIGLVDKLRTNYLAVGAAIAGVTYAAGRLIDHLEEGGRALALDRQIAAIEGAAEKVDALREGLRGTLDTTTLQSQVLLLERVGLTAKQAADVGLFALAEANRRGTDTAAVLQRVVGALSTGRTASLKALGITATDAAGALRQMADIGQSAAGTLDGNVTVAIGRARAAWGNFVSDVEVGAATFAGGFVLMADEAEKAQKSGEKFGSFLELQVSLLDKHNAAASEAAKQTTEIASSYDDVFGITGQLASVFGIFNDEQARTISLAAVVIREAREMAAAFADVQANVSVVAAVLAAAGGGSQALVEAALSAAARGAARGRRRTSSGGRGGGGADRLIRGSDATGPGTDIADFMAWQESIRRAQSPSNVGGGNFILGAGGGRGNEAMTASLDVIGERMRSFADDFGAQSRSVQDSFGSMLSALTDSGAIDKAGAAYKALSALRVAALVAQAGVEIPAELAAAASAFGYGNIFGGIMHTASALKWGIVAGTSVAGLFGGSGSSAATSSATGGGFGTSAQQSTQQAGPTVIVLNGPAADYTDATMAALDTAAAQGRYINPAVFTPDVRRSIARAAGRGV